MLATAAVSSVCAYASTAADWSYEYNSDTRVLTYTTTVTGGYNLDLVSAGVVTKGESFDLTITMSGFANYYGVAVGTGDDPYNSRQNGNDQFSLYLGSSNNQKVELRVNAWSYDCGADQRDYSGVTSENQRVGFTFSYRTDDDAEDGNSYFSLSSTGDSALTFTEIKDNNVVRTYNFANLTNMPGTSWTVDPSLVTTITMTKYNVDAPVVVPEPATATLSLLALAGLAARRRRH